jgi:Zn-finger protein
MEKLTCSYCGKVKKEVSFFIGASSFPNWTMHEGTGKISCPDCYFIGSKEGQAVIEKYINSINTNKR